MWKVLTVIVMFWIVMISSALYYGTHLKAHKPVPKERCYEDQACWNCKTMGNRKCG